MTERLGDRRVQKVSPSSERWVFSSLPAFAVSFPIFVRRSNDWSRTVSERVRSSYIES